MPAAQSGSDCCAELEMHSEMTCKKNEIFFAAAAKRWFLPLETGIQSMLSWGGA